MQETTTKLGADLQKQGCKTEPRTRKGREKRNPCARKRRALAGSGFRLAGQCVHFMQRRWGSGKRSLFRFGRLAKRNGAGSPDTFFHSRGQTSSMSPYPSEIPTTGNPIPNEKPTAIPFCRKSEPLNRKCRKQRQSEALTRKSRTAKRNLVHARAWGNGSR